jgi:hypothetical protein
MRRPKRRYKVIQGEVIANAGIISKTGDERVSNFLINIANQNQEEKGGSMTDP